MAVSKDGWILCFLDVKLYLTLHPMMREKVEASALVT